MELTPKRKLMIVYSLFSIIVPIALILISKYPSTFQGKLFAIFTLENIFYFIMFILSIYFFSRRIYFGWITATTPSLLVIFLSTIILFKGVELRDTLTILTGISTMIIHIIMVMYFIINLSYDLKADADKKPDERIRLFEKLFIAASAIYLTKSIIHFWIFIGLRGTILIGDYSLNILIIAVCYISAIILWTRQKATA